MTVKELASFFKVKYETQPDKKAHFPNRIPSQDDGNYFKKLSPEKIPEKHNHSLEVPKHQGSPEHKPFGKKAENPYIVSPKEQ